MTAQLLPEDSCTFELPDQLGGGYVLTARRLAEYTCGRERQGEQLGGRRSDPLLSHRVLIVRLLLIPAGDGADDQKRLVPRRHRVRQRRVGRLVRQVSPAGEEPYERTSLLRHVVADRAAQ